jgi:hypothetical protein
MLVARELPTCSPLLIIVGDNEYLCDEARNPLSPHN